MQPSSCVRRLAAALLGLAAPVVLPVLLSAAPVTPALELNTLGATAAELRLTASPGHYTIQTSTNLASPWQDALTLIVDGAGLADFTVPVTPGAPRQFFRGRSNDSVVLETTGADFTAIITCADGSANPALWRWSNGTTSAEYPTTTRHFGSTAPRQHSLELVAPAKLTKFNIGFNGADGGGATPLDPLDGQNVSRITFPAPLTELTCFGATHNHALREIDFTWLSSLEYIECYECGGLEHVTVSDLPALRRLCVEACALTELDLSGLPNLGDVRAALNRFTSITVGRGTGPQIWHWCTRDNPQMTQNFADIMGNFTALEELYIWNTNQHGAFTLGSMVLRDFQAAQNHFTSVSLPGRANLQLCYLQYNELASIDLSGCTALRQLNLSHNLLPPATVDALLAFLDTSCPNLQSVDLSSNPGEPSATGVAHAQSLVARGVAVTIDVDVPEENDGRIDVPGGTGAITFTTNSAEPRLEIRVTGTPTSVVWHWGDGTITRGTLTPSHIFDTATAHTNYVEVVPTSAVTYFGARQGYTNQGITGVLGAAHFPNLNYLFLYQESVAVLDLAGCASLTQLHLADNPVSSAVCDKWFTDLDAAVAGPVTGADFFFPSTARTPASNAAYQSLIAKGYAMHPY
jgi:Leucine-rich repeat (LRR) protein